MHEYSKVHCADISTANPYWHSPTKEQHRKAENNDASQFINACFWHTSIVMNCEQLSCSLSTQCRCWRSSSTNGHRVSKKLSYIHHAHKQCLKHPCECRFSVQNCVRTKTSHVLKMRKLNVGSVFRTVWKQERCHVWHVDSRHVDSLMLITGDWLRIPSLNMIQMLMPSLIGCAQNSPGQKNNLGLCWIFLKIALIVSVCVKHYVWL